MIGNDNHVHGAQPGRWILILAFAVTVASGCGVTEKRIGAVQRHVTSTRVETRQAPVPNWPVWVFVNGTQVGAFRTNAKGEVPLNYLSYVNNRPGASGLNVEFRYQQPDGKVEREWFRRTGAELHGRTR